MKSLSRTTLSRFVSMLSGRPPSLAGTVPFAAEKVRAMLAEQSAWSAFQPIVDLSSGKIFAYEALARFNEPAFRGPIELFEAAVQAGLCGELGRMLRRSAVENCPDYPLFLNVNPNEFDEHWLVRPDDPIFTHPEAVYVEITESVPLSHFELCHKIIDEIRSKGIRLAVDDLGAGFSNLKYIADLNPDIVKLDRELVAGLDKLPRQLQLVRSIVRLCRDMGAQVVAEGIETMGELEALQDTGAQFGQGYLLARPATPLPQVPWPPVEMPNSDEHLTPP